MGRKQEKKLRLYSLNLATISALGFWLSLKLKGGSRSAWTIPAGVTGIMSLLGSLLFLRMSSLKPADNHSIRGMFAQYFKLVIIKTMGPIFYPIYEKSTRNVGKVQENVLLRILKRHEKTEYGKTWGFHSIKSREEFRHRHPLTEYNHYAEMMERLAMGEQNILTKDKVTFIALTSGTTGKNKKYALTDYLGGSSLFVLLLAIGKLDVPLFRYLHKHWYFVLPAPERKTEVGIPMGPASAKWSSIALDSVCPKIAYKLTQEEESYYAQALFCLADHELGSIQGFSTNLLYTFFKFLERNVDKLARDISQGAVGSDSPIKDHEIREKLSAEMVPKPERAREILREVTLGHVDLAKRLWPQMTMVTMAKSGGFAHCATILESSYFRGLPCISTVHGSTEAWCGLNMDYKDSSKDIYTWMTETSFVEFIPVEDVDKEQPRTLFLDQLKIGECYEVVATTIYGLYRFRVGDILKIVGFFNDTPKYEFCYRLGQRLNLAFEKTPELYVYQAVEHCAKNLPPDVTIVDYTSTESHVIEGITGERNPESQYVFMLEVMKDGKEHQLIPEHIEMLDKFLRDNHSPYDVYRNKGSIGPVKVIQVKSGSFEKLKHSLWNGYQNMQFKMPHVIRREGLLNCLLENQCSF